MRSNSGKDESRNNLRDPTMRDRELGRNTERNTGETQTSGMGSNARKSGQKGDE